MPVATKPHFLEPLIKTEQLITHSEKHDQLDW